MTDSIGDMIIRVKNGYMARKKSITVPHTKTLESIAKIFVTEKYLEEMSVQDTTPRKTLVLALRYVDGTPVVSDVKRMSKPGLRKYATSDKLPITLGGYGTTIVSTSQGVMTGKEAKKKGVGGELLCSIW